MKYKSLYDYLNQVSRGKKVSGARLAAEMGIQRQAGWKYIVGITPIKASHLVPIRELYDLSYDEFWKHVAIFYETIDNI